MTSKIKYKNINNLHATLKVCFYGTVFFAAISLIVIFAIPFLPETSIFFEDSIHGWVYSVDLPIKHISLGSSNSISHTLLQSLHNEEIHVSAAIIIHLLFTSFSRFVLVGIGLKKMISLTGATLNGESPFQLKYIESFRKLSIVIMLYSTLGNTVICIFFSIFVTGFMAVTIEFMWLGILFGLIGYIFSDITEYGLFLQDEYDMTL